jgi:hypothetical protein
MICPMRCCASAGREPLLPILLWRGVLPAPAGVRSIVAETLAQPHEQERLQAPLQARTGAIKPSELSRVIVDTTVQPKKVTFPTDARLLNRARKKLRGVALCASPMREWASSLVYSLHAPEVECVDKGKARRPYEFGVKVSLSPPRSATPRAASSSPV